MSTCFSLGYKSFRALPEGIAFRGSARPAAIKFLCDLTYIDANGERQEEQAIFSEIISIVSSSKDLLILDLFLFNDFISRGPDDDKRLAETLTTALIQQKYRHPQLQVFFITDPVNTIYGGVRNQYLERLAQAGITIVVTDLNKLRDPNPVYSFFWRLFVRPLGNRTGGKLPNPFVDTGITLRSYLALLNLKANHRKVIIADDGAGDWIGHVTTANPHDGSSSHSNVAISFKGAAVSDLFKTENAVLAMSHQQLPDNRISPLPHNSDVKLAVITEGKIRERVLALIAAAKKGDTIELVLLYLADRSVIRALKSASRIGVNVRAILDLNRDAFGMTKLGIPNRPVASSLVKAGVKIRWAKTQGEQCHSKVMLVSYQSGQSVLMLGSANLTRRNLADFNLETDVVISGSVQDPFFASVADWYSSLWNNRDGRGYTTDYQHHEDKSRLRYLIYWLMEMTGISTF